VEDRIGFKSAKMRKEFFCLVRAVIGSKSWEELGNTFGLSRGQFQTYQYGHNLMPKLIFEKMKDNLVEDKQDYFNESIFIKPGNWGRVKGGLITFKKYPWICAKGRQIAIKKRKEIAKSMPLISLNLTCDLCEFVGAIIGDGSIDGHINARGNSKYHIFVTGDSRLDRTYLTKVLPKKISIFNLKPYVFFRKDANAMVLNFFSKKLFSFFTTRLKFVPGNKTYTVTIPEEIMQSKDEFIFATIRGIFDTDGIFFVDKRPIYKKPYPRIALQIVSKPLFIQLKNFLKVHFSLYTFENIKRQAYHIEIYGPDQLDKWMKIVEFSNKRHLDKIIEFYKLVEGIAPSSSA
jgi:intein/homing endonuclease